MGETLTSKLPPFSRHVWLTASLFLALAIAFAGYALSEKQIERASNQRHQSFLLADELRQSSDDLTRMARTYAVTRDPLYKKHYQDILDIRDGKKPRPAHYQSVYWDLARAGPSPAPGSHAAVALLDLMQQAGITEEEFQKLAQAKVSSDRLTATESEAMKLAETTGPAAGASRAQALMMMLDSNYYQAKASIMKPIDEFYALMGKRTLDAIQAARIRATVFRILFITIGLGLMLMLWRTYKALHATLGGSVADVHAHITRIGGGDFSTTIPNTDSRKDSVLGWLAAMQINLSNLDRQRKAAEDEIEHLAFYDPLTHLPNRRLLLDRLGMAIATGLRHRRKGALLLIDLDNFKTINDTLGHNQGDLLLEQVARRLSACIREGDTLARLGGDEFLVMLDDLSESTLEAAAQAEVVGEKIIAMLGQPYLLAGDAQHSTSSIGITLFGEQQESTDDLLKRADLAMYQAKAAGRNTLRFFDLQMQAVVTAHAALETDLREAVQKQQFLLHYQAQVDGEGRLTGVEALLRWSHPQRGLVSPAEFIPLAEDTRLIVPLGHWVLETACTQLAAWAARPERAPLSIAVNVSPLQFHQSDFVQQVLTLLERTGANPEKLKLELTESLLIDNIEDVITKMSALKARGVCFSLDDFGTGYSSLTYLKRLPLDQLKIDQGFVRDILIDPNDAAIARMIVVLAESLGLEVIAEGVETEAQRSFLAGHGCQAYQGYLFSRPLPIEAFEEFAARAGRAFEAPVV